MNKSRQLSDTSGAFHLFTAILLFGVVFLVLALMEYRRDSTNLGHEVETLRQQMDRVRTEMDMLGRRVSILERRSGQVTP